MKFKKIYVFYGLIGTIVAFISCSDQVDKPDTPSAQYTPPLTKPNSDSSSSESRTLSYPEIFCRLNGCASSIIYLLDGDKPYIAYKNDHFNNESITGHKENMTNFSKFYIKSDLSSNKKYELKLLNNNSFCRDLKINNNGNNFEILDPIPKLQSATVCSFQLVFNNKVEINKLDLFFNYTFNDWKGAAGDGTEAQRVARLIDSRTKKLELKNKNIHDLSSIVTLVDLEELNLESNNINEIKPFIRELKKLTAINFSHNKISEITPYIRELSNLTAINLSHNNINKLPKEMRELDLKTIYFNNNHLTVFPSFIVNLSNPHVIDLSHNKIKEIPNNFKKNSFIYLEKLNLDHNIIEELPANIFVAEVKNLSLKHNKIKKIKDFDLVLSSYTKSIDLSHNELSQKINISKFIGLAKIDLSHNKFKSFPIFADNSDIFIKEIILNDNAIQGEIDLLDFGHLINLNLNNNQLSRVPYFNKMDAVVSLANNKFTNFENYQNVKIYSGFGKLDISNNKITSMQYFPAHVWRELNLENNLLEEISMNTFSSTLVLGNVVNLKNNRIVQIECKFFNEHMKRRQKTFLLEGNPGFPNFGLKIINNSKIDFRHCE
jgi:Leucine-rich repeat (LRR) protein